jgi:hypothetical protein
MAEFWSSLEDELIVTDYFIMLSAELRGYPYSKAEHRRQILPLLNSRSNGSIEFKHQNISAVLIKLGQPFIKGYLPRYNYQKTLEQGVIDHLNCNPQLEDQFRHFAEKEIVAPQLTIGFQDFVVNPPKISFVEEPTLKYNKHPIKINYLEKEQYNRKMGEMGEALAIEYEKWNLILEGKEKLAEKIEWISRDQGDGAGFDILSKYPNGKDKYIEVKSTKLSKETPFFFSRNELRFSKDHSKDYHLYRVFNIEEQAKMFIKKGELSSVCYSVPITYKGYF